MKTNINKIELTGFAGTDAELKDINNGKSMARFRMATSRGYKDRNDEWVNTTSWHNVVLWNKSAVKAAEAVKKGSRLSVTGRINYRNYETTDGQKRYTVEIVADTFEVLPAIKPNTEA
jgi:single-strand DNA-binding protein